MEDLRSGKVKTSRIYKKYFEQQDTEKNRTPSYPEALVTQVDSVLDVLNGTKTESEKKEYCKYIMDTVRGWLKNSKPVKSKKNAKSKKSNTTTP